MVWLVLDGSDSTTPTHIVERVGIEQQGQLKNLNLFRPIIIIIIIIIIRREYSF